jgi:hypothetical protein
MVAHSGAFAAELTAGAAERVGSGSDWRGYLEHMSKPVDQERLIAAVKTWAMRAPASNATN